MLSVDFTLIFITGISAMPRASEATTARGQMTVTVADESRPEVVDLGDDGGDWHLWKQDQSCWGDGYPIKLADDSPDTSTKTAAECAAACWKQFGHHGYNGGTYDNKYRTMVLHAKGLCKCHDSPGTTGSLCNSFEEKIDYFMNDRTGNCGYGLPCAKQYLENNWIGDGPSDADSRDTLGSGYVCCSSAGTPIKDSSKGDFCANLKSGDGADGGDRCEIDAQCAGGHCLKVLQGGKFMKRCWKERGCPVVAGDGTIPPYEPCYWCASLGGPCTSGFSCQGSDALAVGSTVATCLPASNSRQKGETCESYGVRTQGNCADGLLCLQSMDAGGVAGGHKVSTCWTDDGCGELPPGHPCSGCMGKWDFVDPCTLGYRCQGPKKASTCQSTNKKQGEECTNYSCEDGLGCYHDCNHHYEANLGFWARLGGKHWSCQGGETSRCFPAEGRCTGSGTIPPNEPCSYCLFVDPCTVGYSCQGDDRYSFCRPA